MPSGQSFSLPARPDQATLLAAEASGAVSQGMARAASAPSRTANRSRHNAMAGGQAMSRQGSNASVKSVSEAAPWRNPFAEALNGYLLPSPGQRYDSSSSSSLSSMQAPAMSRASSASSVSSAYAQASLSSSYGGLQTPYLSSRSAPGSRRQSGSAHSGNNSASLTSRSARSSFSFVSAPTTKADFVYDPTISISLDQQLNYYNHWQGRPPSFGQANEIHGHSEDFKLMSYSKKVGGVPRSHDGQAFAANRLQNQQGYIPSAYRPGLYVDSATNYMWEMNLFLRDAERTPRPDYILKKPRLSSTGEVDGAYYFHQHANYFMAADDAKGNFITGYPQKQTYYDKL